MTTVELNGSAELTSVGTHQAVIHDGLDVRVIDGLEPGTTYEIDGFEFTTLPEPGELLATFATVNDVHLGETVCGVVGGHPEVGPILSVPPGATPYPVVMNTGAVEEISAIDPEVVLVKGDLTSNGTQDEYQWFLDTYQPTFGERLVHVRGNHESYHDLAAGDTPIQRVDLPGATLVLLDTTVSHAENGSLSTDQLDQLDAIAASADRPVLVFGHHHPWSPDSVERSDTYFGIRPEASESLVEVAARRPSIAGYFAGHTHRNRLRHFSATGPMPWVEVSAVKDYPGAWAEYRVHEGGVLQIFHRISSPDALAWTEQTRQMYHGLYGSYALGTLADRCFVVSPRA